MANRVRALLSNRHFRLWGRWTCYLVFVWLVSSWLAVYIMTRRPRAHFAEPAPEVAWGPLESLRLQTRDGEELGAWLADGDPNSPCVLFLHGKGGSRRNCANVAALAAEGGNAVMLVSLRAHGDSTGRFDDVGLSARHDVVTAVEYLERRWPGRPVVVHGTSMGSAAAVFAAGELGTRVSGYILESPYQDLRTAVWNRTENELTPILGPLAYLGLSLTAPLILEEVDAIAPVRAIDGVPVEVPVLILAGAKDRRARPSEAQALFDRVRSHGTLTMFEAADHGKLLDTDRPLYQKAMGEFLRAIKGPRSIAE